MAIALWGFAGAFVSVTSACELGRATRTPADALRGSVAGLGPSYAVGRTMSGTARCEGATGNFDDRETGNSTIAIPGCYCSSGQKLAGLA